MAGVQVTDHHWYWPLNLFGDKLYNMRNITIRALLLIAVATSACRPEQGDPTPPRDARSAVPAGAPSITGVVTDLQPDGRIRIEERPADSAGSNKAVVRLTADARIVHRTGAPAVLEAIRNGTRVSAWFTGPVMESYPVQATANVIVIESGSP